MPKDIYDIVMRTPLGKKHGVIALECQERQVSGYFDIMGHRTPISGEIGESGQYHLRGTIVTLMRTIPYVANGRADGRAIRLTLRENRNTFQIAGALRSSEKGD